MSDRIYMSSPDVGEREEQAILAALRSGWVAPLGPDVDAFERELSTRVGARHAVALSSGTAGLHLGLLALGVGAGDVVITSSFTFAATANAIAYTGAMPHFIDADPRTGNMDVVLLASVLAELAGHGTPAAAIVPVDLLGKVADMEAIEDLGRQYGVPVLADAAESLGARRHGRAAGSFGTASVVSFNGNKIMTTSGGGMLLTDDAELADRVRYLATQARQPVAHYEHTEIGYNYRLSNLLAALGRAQLSRLDDMIARRHRWRDEYRALFAEVDGVTIFGGDDDADDNAWLTAVLVDEAVTGWNASELSAHLGAHDIESRPLWKPMHLQPVFAAAPAAVTGVAERFFRTGITLPSGSALSDEQMHRVQGLIREFLVERA
ncbi:aminotransferase class I/II-fold pyridoxal phosphate-dependent enzyme [Microbacterium sp.]|uniref:DegT/DnrJ/EryC1/StrS family aminotransferase n=1 Tax=Microbacterium sp. TaxID=51671 RepID=UPI00289FAE23|nr:aminotransferase class I/II-fold pyridoxal phosphate-dependent enzyme [Microbacterium sp.]